MSITSDLTSEGRSSHIGGKKVMVPDVKEKMDVVLQKEDADYDCSNKASA